MLTPRMLRMMVFMWENKGIKRKEQSFYIGQWFYNCINYVVSEGYATKSRDTDGCLIYTLTKEGETRAKIFKYDLGIKGDTE